jgi:glutaminyl-tRNA synthetase
MGMLENSVREVLNETAPRRMGVLRPLKVVLTNFAEDETEVVQAMNHPNDETFGTRQVPFARELWIERDDFMVDAPKKFFRLKPGGEVRLRSAYIIRCDEVITDDTGEVVELRCSYDPDTKSGSGQSDRKVKGTIHWVSAAHAIDAEVRLYDRLFSEAHPGAADNLDSVLNGDSLTSVMAKLEPALADLGAGDAVQLERLGYFCPDAKDDAQSARVLNRIVTLRDSWAKIEKQAMQTDG